METCYRHPSRETAVSCSNCGKSICPGCMTSTSVGMRCPECAGQRTQVRTIASVSSDPALTYALIGLNVAILVGATLGGADAGGGGFSGSLIDQGAVSRPAVADGEVWRLLTAGFLHSGLAHLFFNMFGLYILGGLLEPAIGRMRFALIYFVSLLAGSFGALLLTPTGLTVGASGAIFGLMAAAFIVMRARGINPMESGLGLWIGLNLVITFLIPGISIGGHLGGLVGGGLAAFVLFELGEGRRLRVPRRVPEALVIALGGVAVAGSIVVASSSSL